MAAPGETPAIDLFAPETVACPYPALARVRQDTPVTWLPDLGLWLVTRHEDVRSVLRDPLRFSNGNAQKPLFPMCEAAQEVLRAGGFAPKASLSGADPPLHTRLRRHYSKVVNFTPRRAAAIRAWITERTDRLIDDFPSTGPVDLVSALFAQLPAQVIFHLIGFPEADGPKLMEWCAARLLLSWGQPAPEVQVAAAEKMVLYWRYCVDFVASQEPGARENFASELLAIHAADPEALTPEEIASLLFGLIFAGQETTANAAASAIRLLLDVPERWEKICAAPATIPGVVEECLRLEPSIAAWRRITTEPVTLGGVDLPKGAELLLHLGAAGHDPDIFPQPEDFDPERRNLANQLTFGHGIHFCLGAALARTEIQVMLARLSDRFPAMRLVPDQDFAYVPNLSFRGPQQLAVTLA